MTHQSRSSKNGDSFYRPSAPPELKRSEPEAEILPHEKQSDWKRITLLRKTSSKKEIKNIGR
jgi:hypothetical protein